MALASVTIQGWFLTVWEPSLGSTNIRKTAPHLLLSDGSLRGLRGLAPSCNYLIVTEIGVLFFLWIKAISWPVVVAHACNPSILGGQSRRLLEPRSSRSAWATQGDPISIKNYLKISWAWWHIPIVPATSEAEAGESLEPGSQRLQ